MHYRANSPHRSSCKNGEIILIAALATAQTRLIAELQLERITSLATVRAFWAKSLRGSRHVLDSFQLHETQKLLCIPVKFMSNHKQNAILQDGGRFLY